LEQRWRRLAAALAGAALAGAALVAEVTHPLR